MATTTFNGTVRSDGDIKATTKNTTTGAYVDYAVIKAAGGMEIEKVAEETPEKIFKIWLEPNTDLKPYQARQLAFALGLNGKQVKSGVSIFMNLWKVFKNKDCSLMEINPLVLTDEDDVIALDSKINFYFVQIERLIGD